MQTTSRHAVLIHGAWSRGAQWDPARRAFECRGFTVHTPTLRHHELPLDEGAPRIADLSLRAYADDLVAYVAGLDTPPLLVGHSLGGLLAQLVAARTQHAGLAVACPSPVGAAGINRATLRISFEHLRRPRSGANAVYPPSWKVVRSAVASRLPEELARAVYEDLVCESRRALFYEVAHPRLDQTKAATVDFDAVTAPVLAIGGEHDGIVPARSVRNLASRYRHAAFAEIPGADHMVFSGEALPATMARIDGWLSENRLFVPA